MTRRPYLAAIWRRLADAGDGGDTDSFGTLKKMPRLKMIIHQLGEGQGISRHQNELYEKVRRQAILLFPNLSLRSIF